MVIFFLKKKKIKIHTSIFKYSIFIIKIKSNQSINNQFINYYNYNYKYQHIMVD